MFRYAFPIVPHICLVESSLFVRHQIQILDTSVPLNIQGFRSVAMDTWLIEEYLFQAHDPDVCSALKRDEPYKNDPLNFGKCLTNEDNQVLI
jgi:hypothetical protein